MKKLIKILCLTLIICLMFSTIAYGAVKKPAAPVITDIVGSPTEVTFDFSPVKGATGYRVYVSEDEDFGYELAGSAFLEGTTISDLEPSKTYYFKMRAYKTVNGKKYYSKYSKVVSCTTKYYTPLFYASTMDSKGNLGLIIAPLEDSFPTTVNLDSIYSYNVLDGKVLSKMNVYCHTTFAGEEGTPPTIYGETGNLKIKPGNVLAVVLKPANGSVNVEKQGVAYTATYNGKEYLFKAHKTETTYTELQWTTMEQVIVG